MKQVKRRFSTIIVHSSAKNLDETIEIGHFSEIGKPTTLAQKKRTNIAQNCIIGSHVIIYKGVSIQQKTQIEDFCRIGEDTKIGKNCRIVYGAKIYGNVIIGHRCVIGGFIGEDVVIGNNCRIFGELIHRHDMDKDLSNINDWDEGDAPAPIIQDNVFIGFGAKIIGGIKIGMGSFILPNSIVSKDVPPGMIVKGINTQSAK